MKAQQEDFVITAPEQVRAAILLFTGMRLKDFAGQFGVHATTLNRVINGEMQKGPQSQRVRTGDWSIDFPAQS